jgi:hypothetical protein
MYCVQEDLDQLQKYGFKLDNTTIPETFNIFNLDRSNNKGKKK